MKAKRQAKIKGEIISFDVPNKLSTCQQYAASAMVALYAAELHIDTLRAQITALRDRLTALQSDVADYQQTITELDAMLQQ